MDGPPQSIIPFLHANRDLPNLPCSKDCNRDVNRSSLCDISFGEKENYSRFRPRIWQPSSVRRFTTVAIVHFHYPSPLWPLVDDSLDKLVITARKRDTALDDSILVFFSGESRLGVKPITT